MLYTQVSHMPLMNVKTSRVCEHLEEVFEICLKENIFLQSLNWSFETFLIFLTAFNFWKVVDFLLFMFLKIEFFGI